MYQYPYGDSQQLNLDWLVSQWQIVKNGIDQSLQAEIDRVEAAIADLLNARDQAVAAAAAANSDAGDAHTDAAAAHADALAAAGDAADANADALKAEGNAVGEQNGTPVTSGSPYYQNNAKYYATQAASDASDAHTDALAAAGDAADAHTDALAAAGDAAAANTDALKAEGNAVGEQNGTPVTSGSPYYQNNAKYYANEAATVAASIPADYTQLSNDVTALKSLESDDIAKIQTMENIVSGLSNFENFILTDVDWEYGSIDNAGHEVSDTNTTYARTIDYIKVPYQMPATIQLAGNSSVLYAGIVVAYSDLGQTLVSRTPYLKGAGNTFTLTLNPNYYYRFVIIAASNHVIDLNNTNSLVYIYVNNNIKTALGIIAKELPSMTANTNLVENDFRIVNNTLYRITSPIAAGGTLTPNTNCTATTVTNILKLLLS